MSSNTRNPDPACGRPADPGPPPSRPLPAAEQPETAPIMPGPEVEHQTISPEVPAREPVEETHPVCDAPTRPGRRQRLARPAQSEPALTGTQRLLLLDTWRRSGLPAGDFAPLVGISRHTLYAWKKRFETEGPAGLDDKPRGGPTGSRLPEVTQRAILMLKQDHPDWGCERISALLLRGPALPASPQAVARVLHEAGYQTEDVPTGAPMSLPLLG